MGFVRWSYSIIGTVIAENALLHPTRQVHCVLEAAPTGPVELAGQRVHAVLFVRKAYEPAGHNVQTTASEMELPASGAGAYDPTGHGV